MENYGGVDKNSGLNLRVLDFLHRMDEVIEYAREHDVDLVIFAGDAFKNRKPEPTLQREFARRISELARLAPTVLIVGNHDISPSAVRASSVEIYDTLAVPNVWVGMDYTGRVITTKRGDVYVATAPYPVRARLLEHMPEGLTIKQADDVFQAEMIKLLDDMAAEADQQGDMPRLLAGHFAVSGAVPGAERAIMLGRDIDVPKTVVADDRWDYVALGHIHKHQNLTHGLLDAPPVVYSGSLERIDFGEQHDPKGFCWVELARGETQYSFVEVDARPFVTIERDLRQSVNPTQDTIDAIRGRSLGGAVVRLMLSLTPDGLPAFDENAVRDTLKAAHVFYSQINKHVERSSRARLGTNPEGLTHLELLEQYLLSEDIDAEYRAALLDAARELMTGDEN